MPDAQQEQALARFEGSIPSRSMAAWLPSKCCYTDTRDPHYVVTTRAIERLTRMSQASCWEMLRRYARLGSWRKSDVFADDTSGTRLITVWRLPGAQGVPVRAYGVVPKMSLTPGQIWRGAPAIGEDTTHILSRLLGLPDDEILKLYDANVVHRIEPFTTAQVSPARD